MKRCMVWFCYLFVWATFAQTAITETDRLTISGNVKKEMSFSISALVTIPSVNIKDVEITNHFGKLKGTYRNLKGILLKTLLEKAEITSESPKLLSEYYYTCVASDGYKIVFSWNEIFNTEVGNHIYLLTQKDSMQLPEMKERIIIISTSDFMTGRRNMKALSKIVVERVQ